MAPQDHEDDGIRDHKMSSSSSKYSQRCSGHCESHYYWHHQDDRQKHFFKVMVGDFCKQMTVPAKFSRDFRGQISQVVKLEAPDGNLYDVNVSREDLKTKNKLVFRHGWGPFCSACELKQGDVVVFRYAGDSRFKVLVFDPSGCEKELFRGVMNPGCSAQHNGVPHEQSPSGEGLALHELSRGRKASKMSPGDSPSQRSKENTMDPMGSGGLQASATSPPRAVFAKGCKLTTEQKARLDSLEKIVRPEIPLYVANTNRTNLSDGFMSISKDYSDKYLPHEDQTIALRRPPGIKKREASLKVSTDGAYIFSAGWPGFACDNRLRDGDACALEVSRSERRLTLMVTVHPLQRSYSPPAPEIHLGYVGTQQTSLTPEQRKKVEEKVREIRPETPLFLSVKRRGDSMYFGKEFAMEYLPREARMVRLRRPGVSCSWEMELHVSNRGKLHQLRRGWKQFADDNVLLPGDLFLLQLPADAGDIDDDGGGELDMTVYILRQRPHHKS
ncbi:hypothetical protein BS78_08G125800 [Paspalum vaginatum]|nr:hypothetical protein BS78_08G125800 [Paspalum vaginatum]